MKHAKLRWHDAKMSVLEGAIARGDRRLGQVIESAWRKGCKFDAWSEWFRFELWKEAFEEHGLSIEFYANRTRDKEEILPWSHINCGVDPEFLWCEHQRAIQAKTTPDCRVAECTECGAC